jgi:hypothetical protein
MMDSALTPYNQAVIGPVSQVTLGYLKITTQNESQNYRRLLLSPTTGTGNPSAVFSIALFDGATQIANFVSPASAVGACIADNDMAVGDICFNITDTIYPTTFYLNTPKSLKVVANLLTPTTEGELVKFSIKAGKLQTLGTISGTIISNTEPIDLYSATRGVYAVHSNVVEVEKSASSPSGNVFRGTFINQGVWNLNLSGAINSIDVASVTFTSLIGLPNTATTTMFRLYDYTNSTVVAQASVVNATNGTVTFDEIPTTQFQLTRGIPRNIALQVTTTDAMVWPSGFCLLWTIANSSDIGLSIGAVGYNGTTWSIPATANTITLN